jgi:hypothetical protein
VTGSVRRRVGAAGYRPATARCRALAFGIAFALFVTASAAASSNLCSLESMAVHGDDPMGPIVVQAVADALRTLEPSLPRTRLLGRAVDDAADGVERDVRYLAERGLLPSSFDPSALDEASWQVLVEALLAGYGLPPLRVEEQITSETLEAELDAVVARILAVIRPVVLLAWDPDDDDRIAFVGLVLNWSPYPRLVVMRPPDGWTMSDGARELAGRVSLCGAAVRDWVSAPAPVARALFVQHADDAPMYLVGSDPERDGWPYRVPAGEEIAVFAFEHPEVADLERFSAVFAAEPLGIMHVVRLLPQVRTNLSPMGFVRAMQTPPRRD